MTDRSRKRSSKWDTKEDHLLSTENVRERGRELDKLATWHGDGGYSTRMSPGLNEWRNKNHRHSPRDKYDRPARNISRSRSRSRSPIRGSRRESGNYDRNRSRSSALCRDFGAGRCRRGGDCPFVHEGNRNYDSNWEDRHRKGGLSKYSTANDVTEYPSRSIHERERERERAHERSRSNSTLCKYFAAGNCQSGKYCRFSHDKTSESPGKKMDEANKYWEDPRLRTTGPVPNAGKLEDVNGRRGALDWRVNDRFSDGQRDSHYEKESRALNDSTAGDSSVIPPEPSSVDKDLDDAAMSPDWNYSLKPSNHAKEEPQHSTYSSSVPTSLLPVHGLDSTWNRSGQMNQSPSLNKEVRFDNHGISQSNLNFSSNVLHGQGLDQNQQNLSAIALPNLNLVGQANMAIPVDLYRGARLNEPNIGIPSEGKLLEDSNASQISGIPINNIAVRGEQLTQLTNISASLAQLLEAGKQLPQLYAALGASQPPAMEPVNQVKSVLSNVSTVPQEQYDHLSDSTGQEDNIDGLKGAADGEQTSVLPFENLDGKDSAEEAAEGSKKVDESKEARSNDETEKENVNGVRKDEGGKKNKESKSARAFKFALAEFAKELLKPTWKDGLVGKEAYKTIVKKVVIKVTGSLQGANIPHSQEKIEQYLSVSKPKLTKLVQAYVEKFQKASKKD